MIKSRFSIQQSMPRIPDKPRTDGSSTFDPDKFFEAWEKDELTAPYDNDIRKFIIRSFGLHLSDTYVYKAIAEVSLLQAQTYVEFGGQGRLHEWYKDEQGQQVGPAFTFHFSVILKIRTSHPH